MNPGSISLLQKTKISKIIIYTTNDFQQLASDNAASVEVELHLRHCLGVDLNKQNNLTHLILRKSTKNRFQTLNNKEVDFS